MKNEQCGGAVLTGLSSAGARVLEHCSRSTGIVTSMHESTRCRVWRRCTHQLRAVLSAANVSCYADAALGMHGREDRCHDA
jgi:hypothetical protein